MSILIGLLYAVGVLVLLITVHELGHLLVALALRSPVCSLNIGTGPKLVDIGIWRVRFKLFAFPLGGEVICLFRSRYRWKNILLYSGGPLANFVFGGFLLLLPFQWVFDLAGYSFLIGALNLNWFAQGSDGNQILEEIRFVPPKREVAR